MDSKTRGYGGGLLYSLRFRTSGRGEYFNQGESTRPINSCQKQLILCISLFYSMQLKLSTCLVCDLPMFVSRNFSKSIFMNEFI